MADDFMRMPGPKTADPQSFCQGVKFVMDALAQNRDHYRALLSLPKKTKAEVLAGLYRHPPDQGRDITEIVANAVDIYVIPPFDGCAVDADGVYFKMNIP